jgi:hypothetical protein
MDMDVYKPPEAKLVDEQDNSVANKFFIVSPGKFLILYLGTFGLYDIYWSYKNWSNYRNATSGTQWPIARAIFAPFFAHSLFKKIALSDKDEKSNWPHVLYATVYLLLSILNYISDLLIGKQFGPTVSSIVTVFILFGLCWSVYQVQLKVNLMSDPVKGEENSNFTFLNIFWISFGLLIWFSVLATIFADLFPEFLPDFINSRL